MIQEQAPPDAPVEARPRRTLRVFTVGLSVRLAGVGLIWLGDGHDGVFRKGLVVAGVVLSIGGIGVLKYLLLRDFRWRR
jgi:hypothetical protein